MGDDVKRDYAKRTTQRNHLPGIIFYSSQNDLQAGYSLPCAVPLGFDAAPLGFDESRIGVRSHGYKR